ncbi:TadE family type IV pilus minor pilin [Microbacterium betulae]|uniref:TadE family type IV pilus minor pilin n=1 Tax=Microbacterium betulae TaxID=2981139 RepID=A0AA97FJA4_9MICO|nr:TadE family type IV pilus minor pilin [Microbacterium sp. AB]WOF24085.1 TadE family type IV pilus minor pilin [Microbacterium sp. AB]
MAGAARRPGSPRRRPDDVRDERGSVAAELAVALPAVVLVAALGIAGLGAASRQVQLQDAAADAARLVARGEDEGRAAAVVADAGGRLAIAHRGDLVCATASGEAAIGSISMPLEAVSCALAGGL